MGLKYFTHRVYKDTKAVFNAIMDELIDIRKHIDDTEVDDDISGSNEQSYIPSVNEDTESDSEYKGYFKIDLVVDDEGKYTVRVYDGAYPYEDRAKHPNYFNVNGVTQYIAAWEKKLENLNNNQYIKIHIYVPDGLHNQTIELIIEESALDNVTNLDSKYTIGRIISTGDGPVVIQDSYGRINVPWYTVCGKPS